MASSRFRTASIKSTEFALLLFFEPWLTWRSQQFSAAEQQRMAKEREEHLVRTAH